MRTSCDELSRRQLFSSHWPTGQAIPGVTDEIDHVRLLDEKDEVRQEFAANLRRQRKAAGMSLNDVARAYGCTRSWISKLESGSGEPNLTTIVRLARVFHVEPADLMRGIR